MEHLETRAVGSHTVKTYYSEDIANFANTQKMYREIWLDLWTGDDEGRLKAEQTAVPQSLHLVALKEALDKMGEGDSSTLAMYAVHNLTGYMVNYLHGRGDFTFSLVSVLKQFNTVASEVGKMRGYKFTPYENGWSLEVTK